MAENSRPAPTIAFLGIGRMGEPMASRLIDAGFHLRAWNRSPEVLTSLIDRGAVASNTPANAARGADFLVTMLPDGPAVNSVMKGDDGALSQPRSGAIWLQMSSVGVEWSERLGALVECTGVEYVDAPVSGSVAPAKSGTLVVLASGPEAAKGPSTKVFEALSQRILWLGEAGKGSRAKLVLNNWLVDLVETTAETLKFASALELDPAMIVDILSEASIGSPYAVAKARQMLAGDFAPSFALKLALKDAELALTAAHSSDAQLHVTEGLISSWRDAEATGLGDFDLSVVYRSDGVTTSA